MLAGYVSEILHSNFQPISRSKSSEPKIQKQYEKAMKAAQDALELGAKLEKEFGIPPIKY